MRIALSGASGYLGGKLARLLVEHGHTVVALGRDRQRLQALAGIADTMELDLAVDSDSPYDQLGRPEVFCHLAWGELGNYRAVCHLEQQLPLHARFLRALVEQGLPRLLVTGTCLEYGLQCGALHESLPTAPVTAYGLAKDALRRHLELLQREHRFALCWLRLFYLYAADQPRNALYAQLQRAVSARKARFPMSSGEQLRDFLPVERVVRTIAALAACPADFGVLNLCSGQPVSVRAQVERWIAEAGWPITPDLGVYPQPGYEPLAFWGDSQRLERALAQCPQSFSRNCP